MIHGHDIVGCFEAELDIKVPKEGSGLVGWIPWYRNIFDMLLTHLCFGFKSVKAELI